MSDVCAQQITVRFGSRTVLDAVDLEAPAGAISGVGGPSGSGKSTLLRVLAGLQQPDAGRVRYGTEPVPGKGAVSLLAQHPRLVCNPRWTLRQIIAEPATIRGASAGVDGLGSRVGLDPDLLARYPGQVSDGQLQRACLARVLAQAAGVVLCDEPTSMLDPIAAAAVAALLREIAAAGAAVVLVSHDPDLLAALADRTISLARPSPG